jgi:hypothetical protein
MLLVINMAGKRKQESLLNFFKRHKNDGEASVNEADSGTLNENPLPDDLEVENREEPN